MHLKSGGQRWKADAKPQRDGNNDRQTDRLDEYTRQHNAERM